MEKDTGISERISQVIDYLNISKNEFAKTLRYNRSQSIYDIVNGKAKPSFDFFNRLLNSEYSEILNSEWLLTGKGEMIKTINNHNQVNDKREIYQKTGKTIPLIPVEAFAGNGGGEVSIKEGDIQDRYVIPDFIDVDFMIRVQGSSMYPKYSSGDIIACKIIKERSFFQWGRVFVIHHREQGTMLKRLFPANEEEVECQSDNPGYPAFKISLEEITNIALVKGVVRLE